MKEVQFSLKPFSITLKNVSLFLCLIEDMSSKNVVFLQWFRGHSTGPITCATYSCDSQSVYAAFESGDIIVFSAALVPQCKISPEAYLTASPRYAWEKHKILN